MAGNRDGYDEQVKGIPETEWLPRSTCSDPKGKALD